MRVRRRALSPAVMTVFSLVGAALVVASNSAVTPLYRLYQQSMHLTPLMITLVYAVYTFSLLAAGSMCLPWAQHVVFLSMYVATGLIANTPVLMTSMLVADCMGLKRYGSLQGILGSAAQFGAAFGPAGVITLDSPATPERIYWAIERARASSQASVAPATGVIHG